jgi:hypothetical protein
VTLGGITASGTGDSGDDDDPSDDDLDIGSAGGKLDVQSADDGVVDDDCAEVIEDAVVGNQPADIIIAIDNSVSMSNEIALVQDNMNDFSSQIAGANIDSHVIMISGFQHNSDSGICIPPPLGSGLCPMADHNPPAYWRVGNWVGSHSALARIVEHYADYSPALRATAATHVLVVSDDNSDWSAQQFIDAFTALNPNFADFIFHGIVAGNGSVYMDLASQTAGLIGDLSAGEFQPIFDELAADVITTASLACEYEIPAQEAGQHFNIDEVNVEFQDGAGGLLEIGRVDAPDQCAGVMNGWYYDDPVDPKLILLCPQTCDAIQGYEMASISIIFGCDTIPAG